MLSFTSRFYKFREFTLDADQRVLLRKGKPTPVAPKVFDTLLILVEHRGRIVTKEELMNRLWPDTFVEEANLTFNIQQLRKSLRDNARKPAYIETIARRGYRFIVDVEEVPGNEGQLTAPDQLPEAHTADQVPNELRPHADLGGEDKQIIRETNLDKSPADDAAPARAKKWLVATLVIFAAVLAFLTWELSGASTKSANDSKRIDSTSGAASPLRIEKLTLTGQSRQVAISPDGKYIAYTRAIEKRHSIWVRQLTTNANVEIVPATGIVYGLTFANNGENLYFVRGDPSALYRVSLLGGALVKVIDLLEGNFSLSSDDRQLVFVRRVIDSNGQTEYSLITANSDGGGERVLLTRAYPDKLDAPVWSPGDRSVICTYGSSEGGGQNVKIVEVNPGDGSIRELSSERFFNVGKLAWLPQKGGLILAARKNAQGNKELWRVLYPSMEITQITEGLSPYLDLSVAAAEDKAVASHATRISDIWVGSSREPRNLKRITQAIDEFCWTPGGRLLYQSTASGNGDLWITQPDGAEQRQLTNDAAVDGTPAVTPDNRFVVFTSNRSGALQLWRMNLDGSDQIQLSYGSSKNYPAISPDGKWVIYNTTDDWHLWKMSIDGGEPVCLTQYPASFPSVSPDGKMIACVGRIEPKRELSILILSVEGGQPLRRIEVTGAGFSNDRIQWTPDSKALLYATNRDGPTVVIKQPLQGGRAEEIMTLSGGTFFDFRYSSDGKQFAVTRGEWQHDIVLIEGLNRH